MSKQDTYITTHVINPSSELADALLRMLKGGGDISAVDIEDYNCSRLRNVDTPYYSDAEQSELADLVNAMRKALNSSYDASARNDHTEYVPSNIWDEVYYKLYHLYELLGEGLNSDAYCIHLAGEDGYLQYSDYLQPLTVLAPKVVAPINALMDEIYALLYED